MYLWLLLLLAVSIASAAGVEFGQMYSFNVSNKDSAHFSYEFRESPYIMEALRISVASEGANAEYPVLVVAKQQRDVISWRLPQNLGQRLYFQVARTLCPSVKLPQAHNQSITVEVSTQNPNRTIVLLNASLVPGFNLQLGLSAEVEASPSQPQYLSFAFPANVTTVRVRVTSEDTLCMRVSVQAAECPVYDLARNVDFAGMRQTASKKASFTVSRNDSKLGLIDAFYVVLVILPDDSRCRPDGAAQLAPIDPRQHGHELYRRTKRSSVIIEESLSVNQYFLPVFAAIGVFLLFFLGAFVVALLHYKRAVSRTTDVRAPAEAAVSASVGHQPLTEQRDSVVVSTLDEFVDVAAEADREKEIFRLRKDVTVRDLARKPPNRLCKKYKLYYWYLIIISIFYCLPVVQLVLTYQKVLNASGDEDMCFYNFDCMHTLGVISSFNNVFSNIGYVLLGLLFLILCWRRDLMQQNVAQHGPHTEEFGLPQHYGLFYALGIGMVMEGVMSGCYHICPSYNNFQFDTAFMYMLAGLCMLKLYQTRHPDVNASAHMAYMALAIVILTALLGVFYSRDSAVFYSLFCFLVVCSSALLTLEVYYVGRWRANVGRVRQLFLQIRTDGAGCLRPQRPDRLLLLLVANCTNWALALYGVFTRPRDFGTFLLSILMVNLLMYLMFYVIMKLRSGERFALAPVAFFVTDVAAWAAAGYFFLQSPTNWELTAAISRVHNQPCVLLYFYDVHDVWHFLSAVAIFFGFMVILTVDDDLEFVRRDAIRVF